MKKLAITSTIFEQDNNCGLKGRYIDYIFKAMKKYGADVMPVMLPQTDDEKLIRAYAEEFDGFIFSGGCDIHPKYYGEEVHECCGTIKDLRDTFEMTLVHYVRELDKPALGICRGLQVMAVAVGATLWQDIPSETGSTVVHAKNEGDIPHYVKTEGYLRDVIGADIIQTNSYHHQAVKNAPDTLEICGRNTVDGIVEAIRDSSKSFYFALQWHPEADSREESLRFLKVLFEAMGAL